MTARETPLKNPESSAANPANPIGQPHFDGREMVMVHDMFRREFALLESASTSSTRSNPPAS
jgi:hypothetical protein